ncbi:MAG TPA: gliding motility-associated C-terminal domain-containing protein, partial [Bacteroidales bacterium]
QPEKLIASYIKVSEAECTALEKGMIVARQSGGTPDYTYLWLRGTFPYSTNDTIDKLSIGDYTIIITDANACKASAVAFFRPSQGGLNVSTNPAYYGEYNISCPGKSDGAFTPYQYPSDANIQYTYEWSKLNENTGLFTVIYSGPQGSISGLSKGVYKLFVKNSLGCTSFPKTDTLKEPSRVTINPLVSKPYENEVFGVSCHNSKDGSIHLNPKGGHGGYQYFWRDSTGTIIATTKDIGNLDAGKYYLRLADTSTRITESQIMHMSCDYFDTLVLTKPAQLVVSHRQSDYNGYGIDCNGSNTGYAKALANGGFGKYSYTWSKVGIGNLPFSGDSISKLAAGQYVLTVGYGKGCNEKDTFELTQPLPLSNNAVLSNYNDSNISCFGLKDGFIHTTISQGVPGYTYNWQNLPSNATIGTSNNLDNIGAGNYKLTVRDKNNCSHVWNYHLSEPDKLGASITSIRQTCNGVKDGKAFISNAFGGIKPYMYKWLNGSYDTVSSVNNLVEGSYNVVMQDKNGCFVNLPFTILEPNPLNVELVIQSDYKSRSISCYNASDAKLYANVMGGTRPYIYHWSRLDNIVQNFSSDSVQYGLSAGKYGVIVSDSSNCHGSSTITITQPDSLQMSLDLTNVNCYLGDDGKARATVIGGTRPYRFMWNFVEGDSLAEGLRAGNFNVDVYDANNCYKNGKFVLTQPDSLRLTVSVKTDPYCPATFDGQLKVESAGGVAPYQFNWNTGSTSDALYDIQQGQYLVTVTDAHSCTQTMAIELKAKNNDCVSIPLAFSPNKDGYNEKWNILAGDPRNYQILSELYPKAVVEIYNRWGTLVYRSERGYKEEWDGRSNMKMDLPMDSYYYSIDLGNGSPKIVGIVSIIR